MKLMLFSITFAVLLHGIVCNAVSIVKKSSTVSSKAKTVICYLAAKAETYSGDAKLSLNKVDVNMCGFVGYYEPSERVKIDSKALPSYLDEAVSKLVSSRIAKLKAKRSDFKIVLDADFPVNSELVDKIYENNMNFDEYAESLAEHIQKLGFDGFVFYFGWTGLEAEKIKLFTKACSKAFRSRNLLILAYSLLPDLSLAHSYTHFDYLLLNAATYSYQDKFLRVLQPLYPRPDEADLEQIRNVDWFINYYANLGFPRCKILLDVNTDSKTYKILDGKFKLGSPVKEKGISGPITLRDGNPAYFEICSIIKGDGWKIKYNQLQQGPYAYNKTDWIAYENVKSLEAKAKFINNNEIGGAWLGSLQLDDHSGKFCNEGKYPLTTAFLKALNDD